jgi:hypothetical protein
MTSSTKPYPFPRRFQTLVSLFAAISVVMLIIVFSSEIPRAANPGNSQSIKSAKTDSSCCSDEANKLHHLAGSYYTLNDGFKTKLLLNNKGPDPIEIQPTLFSLGGEQLAVSPVTVVGNSHKFVDLSEWVNTAGGQFREGSIQLLHSGKDLVIGAQLYLTDREHSLSFEEKLTELGTGSPRLEGVWWLPSPKGTVSLVLSNTGSSSLSVTASIRGRAPKLETSATLELSAHETKVVNIEREMIGGDRAAMAMFGAISLEHNGAPGALVARAMAFDGSRGYSLPIQFIDPASGKSTSLHGAGLRIGRAGSDWLSPKVVVSNVGSTETVLTGRINYTTKDGTNGSIALPATRLVPQQVELLDLLPYVSAGGVRNKVASAGVEFEYDGQPGSIVTSAFSVSPNGNQAFRVPLWDIKSQRSATGGYPWVIDGDSSTIVYIKNVTNEVREFTLQLRYDGGVYAVGLKSIDPHQTLAFDVREIRDQQIPDLSDNTLPLSASSGQVSWSMHGKQNLALIGRSEQFDVVHRISSNYACQNCCPDSFLSGWVTPDSITSFIGDSGWWYAWEQTQNCYGTWQSPFHPSFPNWSGSNFVCSCDAFGFGFSEGPGSSTISANWSSYIWGSFESGNPNECSAVEQPVLADALCDVLFGDVDFTTVTFSNISANFNQFGSATLDLGTANGGTGACTQGASNTFQITVNFNMPSGASSISHPSVGTFVTDNDKQKFSYTSFSFQNVSFNAPPHGQMVIGVFLARPAAPRDSISLRIGGRYPNGDSWTGSATVHLVCP